MEYCHRYDVVNRHPACCRAYIRRRAAKAMYPQLESSTSMIQRLERAEAKREGTVLTGRMLLWGCRCCHPDTGVGRGSASD